MLSLKNITHYSPLRGLSKPDELVKLAKEYGYTSLGITDYGLSGSVEFSAECKKAKIKSILGTQIKIQSNDPKQSGYLMLVAKNKAGWKNLIWLSSISYCADRLIDGIPTLTLEDIKGHDDNLFCLSGHRGSFEGYQDLEYLFGNDLIVDDQDESRYLTKEQAVDHRVLICSYLKETYNLNPNSYPQFTDFFNRDDYFLPTKSESKLLDRIENECEEYSITNPPKLPNFPCPNGMSELDYLRQLSRDGYARRYKTTWDKTVYGDRAKMELAVIEKANLAGYFLIVADYVNWAKKQGWLVGPGRGSAAGSLISYLTAITEVDPIEYDLAFERFYNEGRNSGDNIEYPDIDVDFPIEKRDFIIGYLRDTYGHDKVSNMATFGRLAGRGALKEVLRIHSACDSETMNLITKELPNEAEISDKLEESKETSIIRWTLENEPDLIKDWCHLDSDGKLAGDYATYFEQAIKIEGTYRNIGKHASGIIVAAESLNDVCPMMVDKSGNPMTAIDMDSVKKMGHIKLDLLGISGFSKIDKVKQLLRGF